MGGGCAAAGGEGGVNVGYAAAEAADVDEGVGREVPAEFVPVAVVVVFDEFAAVVEDDFAAEAVGGGAEVGFEAGEEGVGVGGGRDAAAAVGFGGGGRVAEEEAGDVLEFGNVEEGCVEAGAGVYHCRGAIDDRRGRRHD